MRPVLMVSILLLSGLASANAQDRPEQSERAEFIRQEIEARFAARVRQELGLTLEQTEQLRKVTSEFGARRRELSDEEQQLRRELASEIRSGEADQELVARLTDRLMKLRIVHAENDYAEMQAMTDFLTPVQRARFLAMRGRLVREIQERRAEQDGSRRRD